MDQNSTSPQPWTKAALEQFLEQELERGQTNPNTVGSWRAAVRKILADVTSDADIRSVDVDDIVHYLATDGGSDLRADSLRVYGQRTILAMAAYREYVEGQKDSEAGTKGPASAIAEIPRIRRTRTRLSSWTLPEKKHQEGSGDRADTQVPPSGNTTKSLDLPFPLRQGFLAKIVIPEDLNKAEAERLCAFIKLIAQE